MSSGSRRSVLALLFVVAIGASIDYYFWDRVPAPGTLVASVTQAAEPVAVQPIRTASHGEPVGPVPGPARRAPDSVNPYAQDPVARQNGRHLFVIYNCSGCHGDHAGGGMGPSLRDESWIYGKQPIDIFDSIASGRAHGMPAWGTLLPPQQIWQLVAYIQSLRTPQEPQPPQ